MIKTASFSHVEIGKDIIVSFYVMSDSDISDGYTIMAMRTPMYESLIPDFERRPSFSDESKDTGKEDNQFLESVIIDSKSNLVEIKATKDRCKIDIRKIEKQDMKRIIKGFKKLNFDQKFDLEIK